MWCVRRDGCCWAGLSAIVKGDEWSEGAKTEVVTTALKPVSI